MKQQVPDNVYVLSPLQQGLLFHSLESPDAGLYVDQTVLTLQGEILPDLLAQALRHTCSRHGALRTTFHWQDLDKPLQVVRREVEVAIEHHDWRRSPEPPAERLESFLAADRRRGFDLSTPPLFRVSLVRLDEATTLLIWTYHHILLDGWSANLLDGETMAAYAALRAGRTPDGPTVRQFGDYIAWLRRRDPGAAETFWRARLAGVRAPTPLGVDSPPVLPGAPGPREAHGERELALGPATTASLRDLARRHQLTLNTLTQGAWALLLHHYSGEPEVVFGATVAGRPAEIPGVESIAGLFINTLPVRVAVSDAGDLVSWWRELQSAQIATQPYEHASLADLQRWSGAPAGRPLFESLLVFENLPADPRRPASPLSTSGASGLRVLGERSVLRTQYPLVLLAIPGERLVLRLTYQRRRFTAAAATRLLAHLATLLEAFPAAAALPPALLSPLTPPERHQLRYEWNDTAVAYPRDRTLPELFAAVARRQPEAVAVALDGRFLTYGELDARAHGLAGRLRRLGVGPEARVGLAADGAPALVLGMLGILQAGGAYVPLDAADPEERLAQTIEAADLRVLVTDGRAPAAWPADRPRVLLEDRAPERGAAEPSPLAGPDALAYVLFTSGSTGRPKAVGVPHCAVARLVLGSGFARLGPAARLGQVANPAFDAVTFEVWGALLTGGVVVGVPRQVTLLPAAFAERLRRERIGALFLTTALFNQVAREAPAAFGDLTDLLTGGEAVDPRAMAAVLSGGAPVRLSHVYGPTESTTFATAWAVAEVPEGAATVPIGRPIANTRAHVLDRALRPVPAGVTGELWLGGDGLARGYLGRPRETVERFLPDPLGTRPGERLYRTGDLVRWRLDGVLEFVGRADTQVKIRGFRVEPGEVEAALVAHPAVAAAAVVAVVAGMAREDRPGERRLAAFVVPRAPVEETEDTEEERAGLAAELRHELGRRLPAYMIPAAFTLLPALPLTANGKVDRRALAGLELPAEAGERRGFVAPRTPIEELLAGAWSAVLGVERVGIHDDFLALGGHSLLATQLLSRLREAFRVELPLASLFEAATIAGQAERVTAALLAADAADTDQAPPLVPAAERTEAPLSFAQQRLWILDRLDPGLPAYNIPLAFTLRGPLRPAALHYALRTVVERHEALRTRFVVSSAGAAGPVQRVEPPADPALPQVDLAGLVAPARAAEGERLLSKLGSERFDLTRGPLLKAALFTTGRDEQALLLTVHHIVADGWSLGILFRELAAAYEAAAAGRAVDLPPLPVQYADYAIWQRRWLHGEVLERQIAFWRQRLAGLPAGSPLAADRPRPALQTWNGALVPVAFPPALAAAAHRLARAERVTPFMALLAACAELLGRTSGWVDLPIGTPVANRTRRETEGLIGFFANTLVLRADVGDMGDMGGRPTVRQLLARMREVTLAATTHQDLPFEKLVEELKPERSLALSPFFQVLFALESAAAPPRLADLAVEPLGVETGVAKFDLSLTLARRGEEIGGACEYNTDLFDRPTIARLAGHFLALVEGFAAHPERPAGSVPWLSPGERQQLLVEWNDTRRAVAEETLPARFARQAARTPDAVALLSGEAALSYGELARRAHRLAHRLRRLAVGPEVPVGIFLEREAALVVALLGVLTAGGAYVPLDPAYPRERLAATLEDCRAPWIVTREKLAGRLPVGPARLLLLDEVGAPDGEDLATPIAIDPRHLAYLIYTSGSTGRPKGVAIEHRSAAALLAWAEEVFSAADLATVFASTSICFDLSVFEIFAPLTRGGAVVLAESALDLSALRHPRGVTLVNTVPSAAAELLRAGAFPATLRTLNLAGEPIPAALAAQLARLPARVLNLYGPSETTTYSSLSPVAEDGRQPPIGRPIAGTEILLLDREGRPVAIGVPGEIHIAGAGLARGYFGRPEATAASFLPRPPGGRVYKTGDLARALPDGRLEFLGRRDHQVKVRGFRIEIGEVETALARHPAVAETVVVVRHDGLVAYVVPRPGAAAVEPGNPLAAELRAELRRTLPEFMIPQAVVELPALPRTATGKVDRAMLPAAGADAPRALAFVEPQTALEQTIAAAISEVMGVERVGREDNFFDLGGSSLLLIRLALRLEERLGRPIQPLELFRFPSVAALARFLAAGEEEAPKAAALTEASEERHQARDRRRALRLVSGRGLGDTRGVGPA
ncbi:MAG TPA: amino acid adenylation domain-containing protein [Thermoanaerobaculia bacterium]|nr:amino acid adenylation domain-containing protein [Thermoanaerobaculia bacterium]